MSEHENKPDVVDTDRADATAVEAPKTGRKILNRRNFLIGSAVVAGGVAFGAYRLTRDYANPLLDDLAEGETAFTPFLKIDGDDIIVITGRAEMGQGANSVLAAMMAEELDVAYEALKVEHGPASKAYYVGNFARVLTGIPNHMRTDDTVKTEESLRIIGKIMGIQNTGGSMTTDDGFYTMRRVGASVREAMIAAAAKRWNVAASGLSTENGHVLNKNGDRLSYGELAGEAAQQKLNSDPQLKDKSQWKYLGKSQPRNDMVPKVTGTATFGMDVELPGMVYAAVRENPYRWRPIKSLDGSAALKRRGVKKVIELDQGFAVVADNSWRAMQALDDVIVEWDMAVEYPADMDAVYDDFRATIAKGEPELTPTDEGDADAALAAADNVFHAEYKAQYLAHMQMEPLNATALYGEDGQVEVWTGTQAPTAGLWGSSTVAGVPQENVKINTVFLGGGFGRRGEIDVIEKAVRVAKEMKGTPVKVLYSREDDFRRDYYRPAALAQLQGTVKNGRIDTLKADTATLSVMGNWGKRVNLPPAGPDPTIIEGLAHQPYAIANYRVAGHRSGSNMPIGAWRSVGASQNSFFMESFIDELAHEHGLDPMQARIDLAKDFKAPRGVLEKVAEMSNWGSKLPANKARGVAICSSFFSFVAQVVEISQTPDGIKIDKLYLAADPGTVMDRVNFEAQMTGGAIFGLSQAMRGEVTLTDGAVDQSNFHDYEIPRFTQIPAFEVAILENHVGVGGAGEPGTPPAAPALGNAIFALTGKRLREMPFSKFVDFV